MTSLGVFRDDFYNAAAVLPVSQYTATAQASGTLAASVMVGAQDVNVLSSAATALTTDSAVDIIAALQNAVATAYAASLGGFAASVNAPPGVPNLFNLTYLLSIHNTDGSTLTITAGAGVTLLGTATVLTANTRVWQVQVNSANTVIMQTLGAAATTA